MLDENIDSTPNVIYWGITDTDVAQSTADAENDRALAFRRATLRMMGMDEAEIELHCKPGEPADLDEELADYNAAFRLKDSYPKIAG